MTPNEEYEWGVAFLPPHVHAYEFVWLPSLMDAYSIRRQGACVLARRPVGEPELIA